MLLILHLLQDMKSHIMQHLEQSLLLPFTAWFFLSSVCCGSDSQAVLTSFDKQLIHLWLWGKQVYSSCQNCLVFFSPPLKKVKSSGGCLSPQSVLMGHILGSACCWAASVSLIQLFVVCFPFLGWLFVFISMPNITEGTLAKFWTHRSLRKRPFQNSPTRSKSV